MNKAIKLNRLLGLEKRKLYITVLIKATLPQRDGVKKYTRKTICMYPTLENACWHYEPKDA